MIDYRENNKWTVYVHIVPKDVSGKLWDKYYVGITSVGVKARWGKNGKNYKGQVFYRAIQKYGWENIQHEIIAENLTKNEACSLETSLIVELKSYDKYGYNINLSDGNISEVEDLTGKTFGDVYVNRKLNTVKTNISFTIYYECICKCGNTVIYNNYQLKRKNRYVACEECRFNRVHKRNVENYQSKNIFSINGNIAYVQTLSGDIILCDAPYVDILRKYTIHVENKKGKPSRVRCYNTDFLNKTILNLEKILYDWDGYIIYKNGNHYDYRKDNLYFVDTSTFTAYHHLKNNIDNSNYLIRKRNGLTIKYYLDPKLYKNISEKPKFKTTDDLQGAIKERNRLLHIKYKDSAPIKELLECFYIY